MLKRYAKDPNSKEKAKSLRIKRMKSLEYKEKRYAQNKNYQKVWQKSSIGKEYMKIYKANRKRKLGFIPINDYFENSHGHHINTEQVIYIPKELHLSHYGHRLDRPESMIEINRTVFKFLTNNVKQL